MLGSTFQIEQVIFAASMSESFKIHGGLLTVGLIYGANYSIAKIVMPEYVDAFGLILVRVFVSIILLWIIQRVWVKEWMHLTDLKRFFLCAIFGVATNQLAFFKGLSMTSPISASIIMTINPVMVLIFSWLILKERVTALKVLGILLGATGAALMISRNGIDFNENNFVGDLLILINATSYALYLVLVKPLMQKYHPISVITWTFTIGLFLVLPFGWQQAIDVRWARLPTEVYVSLAYIILATSVIAYVINVWALRRVNPSLVGYYIYLQPLFATLIAVVFFDLIFGWHEMIYAVLIFAGVYLVSVRK
jgi:drug/metabolite transporter (DMT)-like permease